MSLWDGINNTATWCQQRGMGVKRRRKRRQISHACLEWEVKESKLHLSFPSFPARSLLAPSTALDFSSKHCAIIRFFSNVPLQTTCVNWIWFYKKCSKVTLWLSQGHLCSQLPDLERCECARVLDWSVWLLDWSPSCGVHHFFFSFFLQRRAKPSVANPRDVQFARTFFTTVKNI